MAILATVTCRWRRGRMDERGRAPRSLPLIVAFCPVCFARSSMCRMPGGWAYDYLCHVAPIRLYSDGSFFFGKQPTYGWVATDEAGKVLASGCGRCRNDGSNNVAAEISGALHALGWAVQHGFDHVLLCSDLATLVEHFKRRWCRTGSLSDEATKWLAGHPQVRVDFTWARDADPLIRRAHNLSRRSFCDACE